MWNFNHRNLFPIFKLPHPIINNQQIFVPVYIATDFWFFTATSDMPFQLLSFESDCCLLRWKQFIFQSLIICSLFVFELMNIKGPTRCLNTVQEPVLSINSKT